MNVLLLYIIHEFIFLVAFDKMYDSIKLNGEYINNIRNDDYKVVFVNNILSRYLKNIEYNS